MLHFHIFVNSLNFLWFLIFNFVSLWLKTHLCDSNHLKWIETCCVLNTVSLLENVPSALAGWSVLYMSVGSRWFTRIYCSTLISFMVSCPVVLSIIRSEVLTFLTITVGLPISPFSSVSWCFMHSGALLLGAHMLIIVISSWWIDFYYCKVSYFVSINHFCFKDYFCLLSVQQFQVCLFLSCFVCYYLHGLFPSF